MFGLFKRKGEKVFRIVYVLSATIDGNSVHFDLNNIIVDYVRSENRLDAMAKFCKNHAIFPHVYIHECEEVKIV